MRMMRSMCSGWSTKPEIITEFATGVTFSAALGNADRSIISSSLDVAVDDHVDRVELLVFAPQVDLGHARRLRRDLNLVGRQGRQLQDVGIVDLGLGNLLVHRQDAAGVDGHLQPLGGDWTL